MELGDAGNEARRAASGGTMTFLKTFFARVFSRARRLAARLTTRDATEDRAFDEVDFASPRALASALSREVAFARAARTHLLRLASRGAFALAIGFASGLLGAAFLFALREAQTFFLWSEVASSRGSAPRALFALPFVGLAIVWAYRRCGLSVDAGTNQVVESLHTSRRASLFLAPLIFFSTAATHAFGGSSGREGAALQLGGCVGLGLGRLFRVKRETMRAAIYSGMAGGFASVFGAPLAATIFALEIGCVGTVYYPAFLPSLIAATAGASITFRLGFSHFTYSLPHFEPTSFFAAFQALALGLLCGAACVFFCTTLRFASRSLTRRFPNDYLRAFFGGLCVAVGAVALGSVAYNGAGFDLIQRALSGEARPWDFALKTLFTAATLGAGFKGGEIVPCLAVGSTFGCWIAPFLGLEPSFGAALGMISTFCGATNCPLASLALSVELFGADAALFFALACGASYATSGHAGLYQSQRILYSKSTDRPFDRRLQSRLRQDLDALVEQDDAEGV